MTSLPIYTLSDAVAALRRGDEALVGVAGRSMLPYLRPGRDVALLRPADGIFHSGDIVLARWGDVVVLHRVISADGKGLTLMGDGNLQQTERVGVEDVIGRVDMVCRDGELTFKPSKACLWRRLRPLRRVFLKIMFWL